VILTLAKPQLRYAVLVLERLCCDLLTERDRLRAQVRALEAEIRHAKFTCATCTPKEDR